MTIATHAKEETEDGILEAANIEGNNIEDLPKFRGPEGAWIVMADTPEKEEII